jgi:hypothetical protein
MPTFRPFAIIVGSLLCCSWNSLQSAEPSGPPPAAQSPAPSFKRPELIAIAWASPNVQSTADAVLDKSFIAWRPDGRAVPSEELASIKKELREFGAVGKVYADRLPPLHLVFRIDPRAKNSQRLAPQIVTADGRVESLAVQDGSSPNQLALSVVSVSKEAMKDWPAQIDVEIRTPVEEGDVFKRVDRLTDAPVTVEPGLRMFWTKVATADRNGRVKLLPGIALEADRRQTALVDYDFFTYLTDGTTHAFNAVQSNQTHQIRVSPPLESKEDFDHLEIWRLRYRTETYNSLPIFPERKPRAEG